MTNIDVTKPVYFINTVTGEKKKAKYIGALDNPASSDYKLIFAIPDKMGREYPLPVTLDGRLTEKSVEQVIVN